MDTENKYQKPFLILIVDDVETNLQLLGNILQEQNFDVSFASNGYDALSILETELPDLILLDVMMPEMDGFEVCERVNSNPRTKDIPIIFLTAKAETEEILKGFDLGAVDYVTKPFNSAELLARVKTHLTLKRAKEELWESNLTKSKFFAIITNDLKDSVVGVRGLSKFLLEDLQNNFTEDSIKIAKTLNNDANRLFNFLENLMEWANIQTGKITYNPDNYLLNPIIERNLSYFQDQIEYLKELEVENNISLESIVYTDKVMLNVIINKLLSNAIKYSNKFGKITIDAKLNDDNIEISVEDNGVGIEPEKIDSLFNLDNPFPKTVGTMEEGGTGLGLLICRELVSRIGGKIWIESKKNAGTKVSFTVPTEREEFDEDFSLSIDEL